MVGKLMKHELYAIGRVLIFFAIALLGLAVLLRIMFAVAPNSTFSVMILLFYVYGLLAMLIAAFWLAIVRFYRPLFTGEGYLTLSMPVSADQLIWSKLFSALIAEAFAVVVCVLSGCIFLIGLDGEILQQLWVVVSELFTQLGFIVQYDPLYIVEFVCLFIAALPMNLLMFYLILSLAQLCTRHRIGMAFVIGFAFSMGLSIINTCVLMPLLDLISVLHIALWVWIALYLIADVACFLLVRYILRNKVNLIV
ncbi:MAG TPA: hypothetical protein H9812_06160 [Candidatus Gallimonas intestinigallinarum]|uniref:Uncharacterized protein n=1 Tax=Candidatus Gallimonas intestinigallinarum TaxID=2838604 RepID=A0A9D2IW78_9FIRM|nr:hypothetical protein [Candidatus Gallimonas intestinigallinarum]